jgi:DNA invertase Pin-like site-specific DNA recombinase
MVKVAIYARLSQEDDIKQDQESESIQNQKAMLCDYCKERNWDIYDIYCDEDYSGVDRNRPAFNRLINDCANGYVNVVLCKSQSRFSRDMEVVEKYIHNMFIDWNIRFIGIVDRADSHDVANKKSRQINGLINEWYLEDISDSVRRTLRNKKQRGEFTGSFAPFGYVKDPENKNHLIIDGHAAQIVREIFDWYLQGWGYRKIAMTLNERGVLTPTFYKKQQSSNYENLCANRGCTQGVWKNSAIYRMVRNETYTGTLVQGKVQGVSYKNKKQKNVPKEDWIRVPNCHEPIINKEVWEKTVQKLNARMRACKTTQEVWVLCGKVRCSVCDTLMKRSIYYNKKRTIQYYNLVCNTYTTGTMVCPNTSVINGAQLEEAVTKQLNEWIKAYCEHDKIRIKSEHDSKLARLKSEADLVRAMLKKNDGIINELYEDKVNKVISQERFINLSHKYESEISQLKERLGNIERQSESIKQTGLDDEQRKQLIAKYTCIEKLTRVIADEFVDVVYIGEKKEGREREITVHWKF